jgi:hypothetical protein
MIPERKKWLAEIPKSIREQAAKYDAVGQVQLIRSDELCENEWIWVIVANDEPDFWMNAFNHEHEAREFCQVMNWSIVE